MSIGWKLDTNNPQEPAECDGDSPAEIPVTMTFKGKLPDYNNDENLVKAGQVIGCSVDIGECHFKKWNLMANKVGVILSKREQSPNKRFIFDVMRSYIQLIMHYKEITVRMVEAVPVAIYKIFSFVKSIPEAGTSVVQFKLMEECSF